MKKREEKKQKNISHLCKFKSLDYIKDDINNGIHLSFANQLNDPYEYYEKVDSNETLIGSFTNSYGSKYMWTHYGNSHKGCMIIFEMDKNDAKLKKVNYTSIRNANDYYSKDAKWKQEKEFRFVCKENETSNKLNIVKINGDIHYYYICKVKEIRLGCVSHYDSNYENILRTIKDYNEQNKKNKILVRKVKMKKINMNLC